MSSASVPKSVWLMSGLAVLTVVGAMIAARMPPAPPPDALSILAEDSCFRYGKFECCVKGE